MRDAAERTRSARRSIVGVARKVMRGAAGRTRSAGRGFVGVALQSDAGVPRSNMLDAAEVQQRSARKAMRACRGAACSPRM